MQSLTTQDFWYDLPDDRIAKYPLAERDTSKLLYYHKGKIEHRHFYELPEILSPGTALFFNDTKVIPARLYFRKKTGALIELFLLHPVQPTALVSQAMISYPPVEWECAIGNAKRWKEGVLELQHEEITLRARLTNRDKSIVEFNWMPSSLSFSEVITAIGEIPLPPYLNRTSEENDKTNYQTVYSKEKGAVAAPTAGLHFTNSVLQRLAEKGIQQNYLTLHVSAGTFQPIKAENPLQHTMHAEQVIVSRENIDALQKNDTIIAIGTTAMRTLESIYWFGVKLLSKPDQKDFIISQEDAYTLPQNISKQDALSAVKSFLIEYNFKKVTGATSIYLYPGYQFRTVKGLITNFHQPGSTLILLIAAFTGKDWRKIYQEALENNYRFLSYGDSSLLIP